jgi:hypothetical protein
MMNESTNAKIDYHQLDMAKSFIRPGCWPGRVWKLSSRDELTATKSVGSKVYPAFAYSFREPTFLALNPTPPGSFRPLPSVM